MVAYLILSSNIGNETLSMCMGVNYMFMGVIYEKSVQGPDNRKKLNKGQKNFSKERAGVYNGSLGQNVFFLYYKIKIKRFIISEAS